RWGVVGAALAGAAVAGEAADRQIDALAVGGVARRRGRGRALRPRRAARAGGREGEEENAGSLEPGHGTRPQRGSVTTSTSAGSPRLTTASARRNAGPSSFGSVIGPSA